MARWRMGWGADGTAGGKRDEAIMVKPRHSKSNFRGFSAGSTSGLVTGLRLSRDGLILSSTG
jgi:hypothetical protein